MIVISHLLKTGISSISSHTKRTAKPIVCHQANYGCSKTSRTIFCFYFQNQPSNPNDQRHLNHQTTSPQLKWFWNRCWLEGTRGGVVSHLQHCRQRVSAAWCSRVSVLEVLIGTRRRAARCSIVVESTAEGPGKVYAWITPKDETAEDGRGGLLSVHMRCALRIC